MTLTAQRRPLKETFWIDLTRLDESGGIIKKLPRGRYRVGPVKAQHCFVESTGKGLMKNKNNRRYPAESTWGRHCQPGSEFMEKVHRRRVIGQLEHPSTGRSSMDKGAVIITEVYPPDEDGEINIVFETMSTPDGRIVGNYIEDRAGFGLSSRGNGSTITVEGVDVVQEDFEPMTWDCVLDESTPGSEVAAQRIAESRQQLLEAAGGDEAKAQALALQETEEALRRDAPCDGCSSCQNCGKVSEAGEMGGDGKVPTGYNEFILATPDEDGHYRAYDSGGNWDVYLHIHNLRPTLIASGLQTRQACKDAAEAHLARVVGEAVLAEIGLAEKGGTKYSPKAREFISKEIGKLVKRGPSEGPQKGKKYPQKRAVAAAMSAAREKGMKVPPPRRKTKAESYAVSNVSMIDGTSIRLDDFNNSKEAETAARALEKAAFLGVDLTNGTVTVHTGYADPEQAAEHVQRVLDAAGIEVERDPLAEEMSEMARLQINEIFGFGKRKKKAKSAADEIRRRSAEMAKKRKAKGRKDPFAEGYDGVEEYEDENYSFDPDVGVPVYQMTAGQVSLAEECGRVHEYDVDLDDPEDLDLDLDQDMAAVLLLYDYSMEEEEEEEEEEDGDMEDEEDLEEEDDEADDEDDEADDEADDEDDDEEDEEELEEFDYELEDEPMGEYDPDLGYPEMECDYRG